MKILLIFIDGYGIGDKKNPNNPFLKAQTPLLDKITNHTLGTYIKTNVSMKVTGLPQSATGQTALLTGKNAAKAMGRHKSGFPGPTLIELISKYNIYKRLANYNLSSTFANAYTKSYVERVYKNKQRASVTTQCVLHSKNKFRFLEDIKNNKAIYQDFTNKILNDKGHNIPIFSPEKAANILSNISLNYDFTLYEFFQTDKAGHSQNMNFAIETIENLDKFLIQLVQNLKNKVTIIITSDHGNIEDLSIKTHTKNYVPTIIIGKQKLDLKNSISKITDITPAIISELK
ncbi:MAG: alkaline phosphatase family protein [Bacillota bacterium]